jgi:hypothetical protein
MSNRKLGTILAAIATVALTGLAAQPASATTTAYYNGVCDPGEVCAYKTGQMVVDSPPVYFGQCGMTRTYYDWLWNRTGILERAWSGTNCTGRLVEVPPGQSSSINLFWSIGG